MEGLADLRQGLAYREAVCAIVGRSYDPIFLAEVYESTGQVEEGLHVLAEMRVAVDHSGFRCLEAEVSSTHGSAAVAAGHLECTAGGSPL